MSNREVDISKRDLDYAEFTGHVRSNLEILKNQIKDLYDKHDSHSAKIQGINITITEVKVELAKLIEEHHETNKAIKNLSVSHDKSIEKLSISHNEVIKELSKQQQTTNRNISQFKWLFFGGAGAISLVFSIYQLIEAFA